MFASEIGDFIAKFGHLVGWTAMVGIAWKVRGAVEEQIGVWKKIDEQTKDAAEKVQNVDAKVDVIQNNHMAHIQADLEGIVRNNDKTVEVLQAMKESLVLLVDRSRRDMIVETRIKHVDPTKES